MVCREEILNPDDYLSVGHFSDDFKASIYRFNYAQFHKQCVPQWSEVGYFLQLTLCVFYDS